MKYQDLSGKWQVCAKGLEDTEAVLPGTLDENGIGFADTGSNQWKNPSELGTGELFEASCILTRLTRNHTYEGAACFSKNVCIKKEGRVFLEAERSRELTLQVNGNPVPAYVQGTVSTPYIYEITDFVSQGENSIALCCDNSYPSWPREGIVFSSAATDETQTNWNGILGYLRLRYEKSSFISGVRIYPGETTAKVVLTLDCVKAYQGVLTLRSPAFAESVAIQVSLPAGQSTVEVPDIQISEKAERWDEDKGVLFELTAEGDGLDARTVRFGLRTFRDLNGRLALNGRKIFLRSEANCCVFPETGHMPMTVQGWKTALEMFRSYGVNCMRFHSHCPPEAAFAAADEMGMMMQPELSHWNPRTAFEDDISWQYYQLELRKILRAYANHPSFVMLTMGNELASGALGYKRMGMLMDIARECDSTRLYSNGSNNFCGNHIGPDLASDVFTSSNFYKTQIRGTSAMMRGHINEQYPSAKKDFSQALLALREEFSGPVYGFEVGQYEVLPDFKEWEGHRGVTRPDNYMYIQKRVAALGYRQDWEKRVEATGELSLLSYREEVESVLRTKEYSGLSLLGLQDFPGQGTALVGMLNAHLQPKPYDFAKPERFHKFFSGLVPLVLLEKYTYCQEDTLTAEIKIANYSKVNLEEPCIVRVAQGKTVYYEQALPRRQYPCGALTSAGSLILALKDFPVPCRLTITVTVADACNDYPLWVYPDGEPAAPEHVLVTQSVQEALSALNTGKTVFLTPKGTEAQFPGSAKAQFSTDFWSVGTFSKQSGFMGCMVEPQHPVFAQFPTEFHSNWQWWPMCRGRAMVLKQGQDSLVTGLDCYARMRNMGLLLEARVGSGRLMLSSMGLLENKEYPEVKALLRSIYAYMASADFSPIQEMDAAELCTLVADPVQ